MRHAGQSRKGLLLALVAGAAAGAFSMAIGMAVVPLAFMPEELTMLGLLDALFWGLLFLVFTVPIAVIVGVPAFSILRNRDLLNPASVCTTGLLAGLATIAVMYGISGQSIPLGFLMLGGFGGLVSAAVCSLLIFRRSNHTVDPDARKSSARGSP